jgi:hypothetical protein
MIKLRLGLFSGVLLALACLLSFAYTAHADEYIYGNNYGSGPDIVSQIDVTTGGAVTNNYNVSGGNGRGVVQVGNLLYTTTANSNVVTAFDLTTHISTTAFAVTGATGLSTMAYDGTNFWIGDYSGTNHVYEYSPSGTLLNTVSLPLCTAYCDGLEYLAANGGELISNRADEPASGQYDIYSLTGTLLTSDFIHATTCTSGSTGIAFDGSNYFVSCDNQSMLAEFNGTGTFPPCQHP